MNNGWIKIHRDIKNWQWSKDPNCLSVFINIILDANYEESNIGLINIKKGQILTSLDRISLSCGISIRSVRTVLDKLKSTGEIKIESNNRFSIITICNYEKYQSNGNYIEEPIKKSEKKQEVKKEPIEKIDDSPQNNLFDIPQNFCEPKKTSTAEINGEKNKSIEPLKPRKDKATLKEVEEYIKNNNMVLSPSYFFNSMESCGWVLKNKNPVKDWKAAARTWNENAIKYGYNEKQQKPQQFKNNSEKSNEALESAGRFFKNEKELEVINIKDDEGFKGFEFLMSKELPAPKSK